MKGRKLGLKSMIWSRRKIQPEQNEETRIHKKEERLRNFWDNFKCTNIQFTRLPEGEVEEQELETYLNK